ncbi:DUF4153 domain-containing protein [Jannaschia formosa]|uniref:DUF4153 domain-containing protein n=1 Tax=Jannaschia formosa TaxID=2259592 RepID=UPI000E1B97CB|nr:DUF4173 domain-containing protein [Jannaschia formosa]TFL18655.1 DUF4173 domain-containing protein [Jannaschia formosa]
MTRLAHPLPARAVEAAALLAALLILADWLFFDRALGLSLALFVLAAGGAALWLSPGPRLGPALLLAAGAVPVVELLQPLSALLCVGFGLAAIAWARGRPGDWLRPLAWMPVAAPRDGWRALTLLRQGGAMPGLGGALAGWSLPVGGALVLVALMAEANPVLDGWLARLSILPDAERLVWRAVFWSGLALVLWPLLVWVPAAPAARPAGSLPGVNAASVARALVAFNAVLAVQTVSDAVLLWGGAGLPEGMSWATYAHRGAYPLLATALLAIAFSLIARPHLGASRALKALLVLWLLQNLMLTASSGLRLTAYVEAYGYTLLRLHAAVWMGTVAAGLGLALWQVWRERSTDWLVRRGALLAAAVLWGACLVNFSAIVAAGNAARGGEVDRATLCALAPTAHAALAEAGNPAGCKLTGPAIEGWRDWGFRAWRVRSRLHAMEDA